MVALLHLMLMPMLMMLDQTVLLLLDDFEAATYAVVDGAHADAKMPNPSRHHAGAYVVVLLPPMLPMWMLLRPPLRWPKK